ncbi:hypothetical protein CTI14_35230 [Methylobacterium radiotolerans]|nr:hypothetical protein CTI14_35230 [Methylobacterium radiotolerans]
MTEFLAKSVVVSRRALSSAWRRPVPPAIGQVSHDAAEFLRRTQEFTAGPPPAEIVSRGRDHDGRTHGPA